MRDVERVLKVKAAMYENGNTLKLIEKAIMSEDENLKRLIEKAIMNYRDYSKEKNLGVAQLWVSEKMVQVRNIPGNITGDGEWEFNLFLLDAIGQVLSHYDEVPDKIDFFELMK